MLEILLALGPPLFEKAVELYEKSQAEKWTPEQTKAEVGKLIDMIRAGDAAQAAAVDHARVTDEEIRARVDRIK